MVIKRVSSGKAVKQEKQAVIPGLPVYGSIYLLDLGIEKSLNILFLHFGAGAKYSDAMI